MPVQPAQPAIPNYTPGPGAIQSIPNMPPPDYGSVKSEPAKSDHSLDFGLPDVPGMEKRGPGSSDNLAFDLPDPPSSNNSGPGGPGAAAPPSNDPDYDDLEARFAAL